MDITGRKLFVKALQEEGVTTLFGYPGGTVTDLFDELYKQDDIHLVLPRHEQGLIHEAEGYARATGKPGVCLVTSGPGATNIITGLADAHFDSIPLVCITGQVPLPLIGNDAFQEVDIVGMTRSITKYGVTVRDRKDLGKIIRMAFHIATTGKPGPVLVDIPKDITAAKTEYKAKEPEVISGISQTITEEDLNKAVKMIQKAKKPYIFVGGGAVISGASEELKKFVKMVDAPVCDSLMGKGAFDGEDDLYTGMLGMHGTKASNYGVSECDLLIVVGARFSDRVTGNAKKFAKNAKILQFDVDAAEVNKNIHTDASVIGDAAEILKRVNAKLEQSEHTEWMEHIKNYEEKFPMKYRKDVLNGPYIMEKIYEITNGDAIISTDVGQHQMWAAQHYKFKSPRTLLTSGGLGTMGYGLGASIGAKVGCRDKVVINIAGDGCFRMNMNEIATATRYNIPIIEVIFNNHVLGMVRQWQDLFYGQRYSATVLNDQVDFVKVSEGMGAKAYRVADIESFEKALKEAIELNIPCVIECDICKDDKVFPMVAPGAPISEAFDRDDLNKKESTN